MPRSEQSHSVLLLLYHAFSSSFKEQIYLKLFFFFLIYRASIVQKRIIYFQDEGSLTKKICEQGKVK